MAVIRKSKIDMAVINKVKEFRIKNDLSQDGLASILGMTRGYIGQVESPRTLSKYNMVHLNTLALEFGCSLKDFMPDPIPENYTAGRKNNSKKRKKAKVPVKK